MVSNNLTADQTLFLRLVQNIFDHSSESTKKLNNFLSANNISTEKLKVYPISEIRALHNISEAKYNEVIIQTDLDSVANLGLDLLVYSYGKDSPLLYPYLSNLSKVYIFERSQFDIGETLLERTKNYIPDTSYNTLLDYYYDSAFTLLSKGKSKECLNELSQAEGIIQKQKELNYNSAVKIYQLFAIAYSFIEDKKNMQHYFHKAKDICENQSIISRIEILFFSNYALSLSYFPEEVDNAIDLIDSKLRSCTNCNSADLGLLYRSKGYIYSYQEIDDKAIVAFTNAIDLYHKVDSLSNEERSSFVDAHYGLAESNFYLGDTEEASIAIGKSFDLNMGRTPEEIMLNAEPRSLKQEFEILDYLRLYRLILMDKLELQYNDTKVSEINKVFQLEKDIVEEKKQDFILEDLKDILPDYHEFYGEYLEFLYANNIEDRDRYIFEVLENSRAHSIFAKNKGFKLGEQYNVPQQNIAELKATLAREDKFYKIKYTKGIKQDDLREIDKKIADNDKRKNRIFSRLKNSYPAFFNNFLNPKKIDLQEVQAAISKDKCLIEYQLHDTILFSFFIDKDTAVISQKNLDRSFFKNLDYLLSAISMRPNSEGIPSQIDEVSFDLYNILLADFEILMMDKKEIIISPDGELQFLPFDILKKKKTSKYLIENIDISYTCSASNYFNLPGDAQNIKPSITAFSYSDLETLGSDVESYFSELPGAYAEVKSIMNIFDIGNTTSYLGSEHTVDNLYKELGKEGILHIATHAQADTNGNYEEFMVFRGEPEKLYNKDLIGKEIGAHTVVLSACETAKGHAVAGEGVFHIARVFLLAGVKNVIMTQWVIDDVSGKTIVENFYNNIYLGENIVSSLCMAKRNYLSTSKYKHPYYWASYCLTR
jgi:CHAT domain-containing protein